MGTGIIICGLNGAGKSTLGKALAEKLEFYFIDNEQYFRRPGLYGYDDDYERFAYFDFAESYCTFHKFYML